jgi:hypothetical protein
MDHELEGSGNEDWFERVKRHIEGVIFRILKKKYPFLDSVADIEGGYLYGDIDIKVTFFVNEEPDAKTHRELVDETNFMLQMFLLHKLNDKTATIDVSLVLNH